MRSAARSAIKTNNGVALIRADGHYRLTPLAVAASAPVSLDHQRAGITTRIVHWRGGP